MQSEWMEPIAINLLHCFYLKQLLEQQNIPNYEEIFTDENNEEHSLVAKIMTENLKQKKESEKLKLDPRVHPMFTVLLCLYVFCIQ